MDARAPTRMTHPFATTPSTPSRSPGSDIPNGVLQVFRNASVGRGGLAPWEYS